MATVAKIRPAAHSYIPIIQKPKCCAVACLQMILYRNGHGLYDQEELAVEFGVKIAPEDRHAFSDSMPYMTSFNHDEGISTLESVRRVNAFFKRHKLPLVAKAHHYSTIHSLKSFIAENLKLGNDIWAEYHSKEVYESLGENKIHDAVIESLDMKKNTVMLIDPKPNRKQRIAVALDVLDRALSSEYGKELGLVVVSKK
jgi:hypothetical protein